MSDFEEAIVDIERLHKDAGSLAAALEHHWPTIKNEISKLRTKVECRCAECKSYD
jgi:hypothetical protein